MVGSGVQRGGLQGLCRRGESVAAQGEGPSRAAAACLLVSPRCMHVRGVIADQQAVRARTCLEGAQQGR